MVAGIELIGAAVVLPPYGIVGWMLAYALKPLPLLGVVVELVVDVDGLVRKDLLEDALPELERKDGQ